jgi:hypothetical protein
MTGADHLENTADGWPIQRREDESLLWPPLDLVFLCGMEEDLVWRIRWIGKLIALVPIVADGIGKDAARVIECSGRDRASFGLKCCQAKQRAGISTASRRREGLETHI